MPEDVAGPAGEQVGAGLGALAGNDTENGRDGLQILKVNEKSVADEEDDGAAGGKKGAGFVRVLDMMGVKSLVVDSVGECAFEGFRHVLPADQHRLNHPGHLNVRPRLKLLGMP